MKKIPVFIVTMVAVVSLHAAPVFSASFDPFEATIPEMVQALEDGDITSEELVKWYLARIAAYESTLNAYVTVNPRAVTEAQRMDKERRRGRIRGPLHGIPIVLKDIIHTTDMPTTGGALAFRDFVPRYEATLTRNLRKAGAIILGKTVLTELANWVTQGMVNNYSAVGGFGLNPYDPRIDPRFDDGRGVLNTGGSSSGIAVAANLAAGCVGTETSGSILSPSNRTMLVGIKPTVGLISRYGVIPITADQDTAGPMTRDVASAAVMLGAMRGRDGRDKATKRCPMIYDYTPFLDPNALNGARIGFPTQYYDTLNDDQKMVVDEAILELEAAGAVVEEVMIPSFAELSVWGICARGDQIHGNDSECSIVLKYGDKRDFNKWLKSLGPKAPVRTLTELIAFNQAHAAEGAIKYGQARLEISDDVDLVRDYERYLADRAKDIYLTATTGIDPALAGGDGIAGTEDDYDALLFPSSRGAGIAARPGYPSVTVPFGFIPNDGGDPFPPGFDPKPEPYGVTFTGLACSEPMLIALAYAFEQATMRRVPPESAPPLP